VAAAPVAVALAVTDAEQRERAARIEAVAWHLLALARQLREARGDRAAALWAAAVAAVRRVR
jgi:hypothetical protein